MKFSFIESFGNVHVSHQLTGQCQCCSHWNWSSQMFCDDCKKDAISPEHEKELQNIRVWFKLHEYGNIVDVLKKCNHLTQTKWLFAECLFRLGSMDELFTFLDNWLEESFITNDINEYYVYAFRMPQYLALKNLKPENIISIIESNDFKLTLELAAKYYLTKAHLKFSPFDIKESIELLQEALENVQGTGPVPSIFNSQNHRIHYITRSNTGKQKEIRGRPLDFTLLGEIFYSGAVFYSRMHQFVPTFDLADKALNAFLEDECFIEAHDTLRFIISEVNYECNFNRASNYVDLLQRLILQEETTPLDDKLFSVSTLLTFYHIHALAEKGFDFIGQVEYTLKSKNQFDFFQGLFYYDLGQYGKAAKIFFSFLSDEKAIDEPYKYAQNYLYFLRCRKFNSKIPDKPFSDKITQLLLQDSKGKTYLDTIQILTNNINDRDIDSLSLLTNDRMRRHDQEVLNDIIFEEKIDIYYKLWLKNKKSSEYFDNMKNLIGELFGRHSIQQNNLSYFKKAILYLFLQIIANQKIDVEKELDNVSQIAQNGGPVISSYFAFLRTNLSTKKDVKKTLEKSFPIAIRNLNYFMIKKEL